MTGMPNDFLPQLTRYALVGAINTAIDVTVYVALTRSIPWFAHHFAAAAIIAFIAVVASGFVMNARWTFHHPLTDWRSRGPRFVLVGTAIDAGSLTVMVSHGLHDVTAKLISVLLAGSWNFPMHRKWTFR
jgi:putative flippase GtrA